MWIHLPQKSQNRQSISPISKGSSPMSVVAPRISSVLHGPHLGELDDSDYPNQLPIKWWWQITTVAFFFYFFKKSLSHTNGPFMAEKKTCTPWKINGQKPKNDGLVQMMFFFHLGAFWWFPAIHFRKCRLQVEVPKNNTFPPSKRKPLKREGFRDRWT